MVQNEVYAWNNKTPARFSRTSADRTSTSQEEARSTRGALLSPPACLWSAALTLSLHSNWGLCETAVGAPDLRTSVSSAAECASGLLSLPGAFNYCNYQQPGKGCKAPTLQREKAARGSTDHFSNCKYFTICKVTGIKLQFWKRSFIPPWPHHVRRHLRWPHHHGILGVSMPALRSMSHTK